MTRPTHPFDAEVDAAAFVSGSMAPTRRQLFEAHLLDCESCWQEVRADREGRRLAEMARELAPAGLRDAVRASIAGATIEPRRVRTLPRIIALAAAFVVVASLGLYLGRARSAAEPRPIRAALDAYMNDQVSGTDIRHAPDLSALGLKLHGAERMSLAGMPVEAFTYRSASGERFSLFMADTPFPRAREASAGPSELPTAWEAERDSVGMLSGAQPASYLVVTSDHALMDMFAGGLSSGQVDITV